MTPGSEILERARALRPTIAAFADRVEAERRLPRPLSDALHEAGLFRMLLPRSLGGAELDPVTFVQVMEEVAQADASTAWVLGQTAGCSMVAAYLRPAVATAIFGPPRGVLAWGPDRKAPPWPSTAATASPARGRTRAVSTRPRGSARTPSS